MSRLTRSEKAWAAARVRSTIAQSVCAYCAAPATRLRYIQGATPAPDSAIQTVWDANRELTKMTARCDSH